VTTEATTESTETTATEAAPADGTTILGAEAAATTEATTETTEVAATETTGAPEAYEFNLGEGVTVDQDALGVFEPVLRELNIDQATADKLVGTYAEKLLPMMEERANAQAEEAGAQLRADWSRQFSADPEIGGAKLEESRSFAAKAMQHFMPNNAEGQAFRTFLNESGLGNHPEMGRFLSRVGRQLSEAAVDETTGNATSQTSVAERWYGEKKG
jgi:hypothetical protein